MFLFIPRSLCALKRVTAKTEHHKVCRTAALPARLGFPNIRIGALTGHKQRSTNSFGNCENANPRHDLTRAWAVPQQWRMKLLGHSHRLWSRE